MHDPNYFYELQVDNFLEVQKENEKGIGGQREREPKSRESHR